MATACAWPVDPSNELAANWACGNVIAAFHPLVNAVQMKLVLTVSCACAFSYHVDVLEANATDIDITSPATQCIIPFVHKCWHGFKAPKTQTHSVSLSGDFWVRTENESPPLQRELNVPVENSWHTMGTACEGESLLNTVNTVAIWIHLW